METRSKYLIAVFILLILVATTASFFRYIVWHDYDIQIETSPSETTRQ